MFSKVLFTSLLALTMSTHVTAVPAKEATYPEVIPGPGMPSLEELGLTSEQLYTMTPKFGKSLLLYEVGSIGDTSS